MLMKFWPAAAGLLLVVAGAGAIAQQTDMRAPNVAIPAPETADTYRIAGIMVDVRAANGELARHAGFAEAQRKAWPQLWARQSGGAPGEAPKLGDGVLNTLVRGIDIEQEYEVSSRYVARVAVAFNPQKAARYFGTADGAKRSAPTLLLTMLQDGGIVQGDSLENPWYRAWVRFSSSASLGNYVRPPGDLTDSILLNGHRGLRGQPDLLQKILLRYQAADVAVMRASLTRRFPGGPIDGVFTGYQGLNAMPFVRFTMSVPDPSRLEDMLATAAARLDGAFSQAVRAGDVTPPKSFTPVVLADDTAPKASLRALELSEGLTVRINTPDAQALAGIERRLRAIRTVSGVAVLDLSLGGNSGLRIAHDDSLEWLRYELDQAGLRLVETPVGLLLRDRLPGDTPVARPEPIDEAVTEGPAPPSRVQDPPAARAVIPPPRAPANPGG